MEQVKRLAPPSQEDRIASMLEEVKNGPNEERLNFLLAKLAEMAPKPILDGNGSTGSWSPSMNNGSIGDSSPENQLNFTFSNFGSIAPFTPLVSPSLPKSRRAPLKVPDALKDLSYYERRKRNNLAAKRSRDARKLREMMTDNRARQLEEENVALKAQVASLQEAIRNAQILRDPEADKALMNLANGKPLPSADPNQPTVETAEIRKADPEVDAKAGDGSYLQTEGTPPATLQQFLLLLSAARLAQANFNAETDASLLKPEDIPPPVACPKSDAENGNNHPMNEEMARQSLDQLFLVVGATDKAKSHANADVEDCTGLLHPKDISPPVVFPQSDAEPKCNGVILTEDSTPAALQHLLAMFLTANQAQSQCNAEVGASLLKLEDIRPPEACPQSDAEVENGSRLLVNEELAQQALDQLFLTTRAATPAESQVDTHGEGGWNLLNPEDIRPPEAGPQSDAEAENGSSLVMSKEIANQVLSHMCLMMGATTPVESQVDTHAEEGTNLLNQVARLQSDAEAENGRNFLQNGDIAPPDTNQMTLEDLIAYVKFKNDAAEAEDRKTF